MRWRPKKSVRPRKSALLREHVIADLRGANHVEKGAMPVLPAACSVGARPDEDYGIDLIVHTLQPCRRRLENGRLLFQDERPHQGRVKSIRGSRKQCRHVALIGAT